MAELLRGRIAIVAGGGRGIGAACSLLLAAEGASVAVVDKVPERAHDVVAQIRASGGSAVPVVANLRDDEQIPRILTETADAFGPRIDVLVNIAGGMRSETAWRPLRETATSDWDFVFRQNVRWVYVLAVAVIDHAIERGERCSIVSIGSVSGVFGAPNHAPYGAAKAALIHLAKSLTLEYGRFGIRANVVSPGSVRTPAVEKVLSLEEKRRDEETTPLGRAGTPDDMARAVLFFASELSAFVSGQMLVVDGGASVRFPLPSPGGHPSESI